MTESLARHPRAVAGPCHASHRPTRDETHRDAPQPCKATERLIRRAVAVLLASMIGLAGGCASPKQTNTFGYGTRNAEALASFTEGWSEILDAGRWTESEAAFRKAANTDPDWVMGATLVARITTDVDEREDLLEFIEARRKSVDRDTRLLLDVFILNIRAANAHDRGGRMHEGFNEERMKLAINNFGTFVRRHPRETYMQAEYIEWLSASEGAERAIAEIAAVPDEVRAAPFFASYEARLLASLGQHERAAERATQYEARLAIPDAAGVHALRATLLEYRGDTQTALRYAEKAAAADPKHIFAARQRDRLRSASD